MPSFSSATYHNKNGVHTVNGVSTLVLSEYGSFSKSWSNTPHYRKLKVSKVRLPTNPFSSQDIHIVRPNGSMSFGYASTFPNSNTNFIGGVLHDSQTGQYCNFPVGEYSGFTFDTDVDSKALSSLLSQIKGSSVNLAQAFAERKQTANLLATSAIRIASSVKSLKKGNIKQAFNALGSSPSLKELQRFSRKTGRSKSQTWSSGSVANVWLEMQYGWKPLLSDVYGSAELLAQSLDRPRITTVRVRSRSKQKRSDTIYLGLSDCLVLNRVFSLDTSVSYSVTYELTSSAARILSETGISNPLNLAWELLPWSFVADWFLPVGNYLQSLDSTSGLNFVRGTKSTSLVADHLFIGTGRRNNGSNGDWIYAGRASGTYKAITRTRAPIYSFPSADRPAFKNPFSLTHTFNAIALLRSVFR